MKEYAAEHWGQENGPFFRKMHEADIGQVCQIEEESFATPWSAAAFYNELRNNQFAHYIVLEDEGWLIGYAGMWIIINEAHITNIAIRRAYRGQKWGERLIVKLMSNAMLLGADKMTLEVRVSNEVAQRLYYKMGFKPAGIRKAYYSDNNEDALIMWADLN